ncbi:HEAT repeat domain-containing protein [Listeria booriae]|uniref:HEAT repeat domain-containing protein n=1 Tax=Listeria booriae TaxID=1552123 RepID=UPI00162A8A47|nr:HEAT repeat domain-containing protein [Listeria booriae]MBC2189470.1 HEAT repeat domain-containing protein [Listeria booriae]
MKKRVRKKQLKRIQNGSLEDIISLYKRAVKKNNYDLRYEAIDAMASDREYGEIDNNVRDILLKELMQGDDYISSIIVDDLNDIYDENIVSYCLDNLQNEDFFRRLVSAEYLGRHHKTEAIPTLKKLLSDSDDYVKVQAIEAMGRIGDIEVVPLLLDKLNHTEDDLLKSAYFAALYNLQGDIVWLAKLTEILRSQDTMAQSRAANRLVQLTEGSVYYSEILTALAKQIQVETNGTQKEELKQLYSELKAYGNAGTK